MTNDVRKPSVRNPKRPHPQLVIGHYSFTVMHFSRRTNDRLMIAAESRPSSSCHPERSAARAAVEEERLGGVWAARSRRTSNFFCRRALRTEKARGPSTARHPAHLAPSAAIFSTPPPRATRRSAQDDRLLEERSVRSSKVHDTLSLRAKAFS